jgi:hypothetical protein
MHFKEALRIAAHHLGLVRRPDARPNLLVVPIALGALLMVLSLLDPAFFLLGTGLWLYGAGAAIAGSLESRRQSRVHGRHPGIRAS